MNWKQALLWTKYKNLKKDVIFFLGAGFSKNFKVDDWKSFVLKLIDSLISMFRNEKGLNITRKKQLEKIKINLENDLINPDFALEIFYFIIGLNQFNINMNSELEKNIYKKIKASYKNSFALNSKKLSEIGTNGYYLEKLMNIMQKIITTNYDTLMSLNFTDLEKNQKIKLSKSSFEKGSINELFSQDNFIIPIHGYIEENSFLSEAENIWKSETNFSIIDSFKTFKENYKSDDSKVLKQIIKNILNQLILVEHKIIVFFGYSFKDYFFSATLMEWIRETNHDEPNINLKNHFIVLRDDLKFFLLKELEYFEELNQLAFDEISFLLEKNSTQIKFSEILFDNPHFKSSKLEKTQQIMEVKKDFLIIKKYLDNKTFTQKSVLNLVLSLTSFQDFLNLSYSELIHALIQSYEIIDFNYQYEKLKTDFYNLDDILNWIAINKPIEENDFFKYYMNIKNEFNNDQKVLVLFSLLWISWLNSDTQKEVIKQNQSTKIINELKNSYIPFINTTTGEEEFFPNIEPILFAHNQDPNDKLIQKMIRKGKKKNAK